MHVPDGFVTGPLCLAAGAVSAGVCGAALLRARRRLEDRQVPLLGVTGAFIFAAQMLNFPVAGGTSGHFLGAAFASLLLGPFNACLILAVVLIIQCLGFADGGLTALGVNVLNMGVVGAFGSYLVFGLLRCVLPKTRGAFLASAAVAAWASVVLASLGCAAELALSGKVAWTAGLSAMAGWHALIGIGEALITCTVFATVLSARPDLIGAWHGNAALRPAT